MTEQPTADLLVRWSVMGQVLNGVSFLETKHRPLVCTPINIRQSVETGEYSLALFPLIGRFRGHLIAVLAELCRRIQRALLWL